MATKHRRSPVIGWAYKSTEVTDKAQREVEDSRWIGSGLCSLAASRGLLLRDALARCDGVRLATRSS